jgi:phenol hydroxylase P2 protein
MSTVFIAFQANEDTRPIVAAILRDNPEAKLEEAPAMVKIVAQGRLVVRRETVEEEMGRAFNLQEMHVNLVTITGNIEEDDDQFTLTWAH